MRWTEEQLAAVQARMRGEPDGAAPPERKHKFNAKPQVVRGVRHDSTTEAKRWEELRLAQRVGEIKELERQVRVQLEHGDGTPYVTRSERYPKGRRMTHVIDFRYRERDAETGAWKSTMTYEDVKGFDTPRGRIKRAIAERMIGAEIKLTRGTRARTRRAWWPKR